MLVWAQCVSVYVPRMDRERTHRLHGHRRWSAFHAGGTFYHFLLRLLAQRNHFQPGAGGHDQDFERSGIERAIRPAIGVEQCGYFFFQDQRQDENLFVLWPAELLDKAAIHLGDVRGSYNSILKGVRDRSGADVERKIFDGIIVAEAAALPSRGGSGFHDKECEARRV